MVLIIRKQDAEEAKFPSELSAIAARMELPGYAWEYFITCTGNSQGDRDLAARLADHLAVDRLEQFTLDDGNGTGGLVWVSYSEVVQPGPMIVLRSAAGWYIGRTIGGLPYSRESEVYWRDEADAEAALLSGNYERRGPIIANCKRCEDTGKMARYGREGEPRIVRDFCNCPTGLKLSAEGNK